MVIDNRPDLDGAVCSVDDAGELHKHAVAHDLEVAAAMFEDGGVEELAPMLLQSAEGPFLGGFHQPAVAGHIRRQCRSKPALDAILDHVYLPQGYPCRLSELPSEEECLCRLSVN